VTGVCFDLVPHAWLQVARRHDLDAYAEDGFDLAL
jgi:hypothetical protein